MKRAIFVSVLAVLGATVMALPVLAALPKVTGTVGPGFTISMSKKPAKPGKYALVVRDLADTHNFHLKGQGVNVKTGISAKGTKTFTIKVVKGKYTFVCDAHPSSMRGSFTIK